MTHKSQLILLAYVGLLLTILGMGIVEVWSAPAPVSTSHADTTTTTAIEQDPFAPVVPNARQFRVVVDSAHGNVCYIVSLSAPFCMPLRETP